MSCISCPMLRISQFSKDLWLLLLADGIRNQDLGAKSAYCYWGVMAFGPSQLCVNRPSILTTLFGTGLKMLIEYCTSFPALSTEYN